MSDSERIAAELDKLQDTLVSVSVFNRRAIVRLGLSGHLLGDRQDQRFFCACDWAYEQMAAAKTRHGCELCNKEVTPKSFGAVVLFGTVEIMEDPYSDGNMLAAYLCNDCVTQHEGDWRPTVTKVMEGIFGSGAKVVNVHSEIGHA